MARGPARKLNATVRLLEQLLASNLFKEQINELAQLNNLKKKSTECKSNLR